MLDYAAFQYSIDGADGRDGDGSSDDEDDNDDDRVLVASSAVSDRQLLEREHQGRRWAAGGVCLEARRRIFIVVRLIFIYLLHGTSQ